MKFRVARLVGLRAAIKSQGGSGFGFCGIVRDNLSLTI